MRANINIHIIILCCVSKYFDILFFRLDDKDGLFKAFNIIYGQDQVKKQLCDSFQTASVGKQIKWSWY